MTNQSNKGVAMVLSFLIPGLGQLYRQRLLKAFGFFIAAIIGYCFFILPGIFIHLLNIIDAGSNYAKENMI